VRWGRVVVLGVAAVVAAAGSASAQVGPAPDASWTSFGHDAQVDAFTDAPAFTADVRSFKLLAKTQLDGGIVASPLAANVAGHGLVVFASTEAGSIYAVGADGSVLWHRDLGTVVTNGGCGTYGVTSTGTIDARRGVLYEIGASGQLHALRLADGSELAGWPVRVVRRARTEYVWGGLRLVGNRLYVGVASYCDEPDRRGVAAEGRLLAYDVTAPAAMPTVFDPVPGMDNLGGVWGWGGVAVDASGDVYTGVGDAEPDVDDGASDSMVELTPDLSETLGVNRPISGTAGDDVDLGAAPVLFQPKGCAPMLAANSKSGDLLVWRQDGLARGPVARIPLSDGVDAFVGAPSWSPQTQMLYDAGATAMKAGKRLVGTMALAVARGCTFTKRWFVATGDGSQPEPLVAGDLVASTGGSAGGFVVVRAGSGVVRWRYPTRAPTLAPLVEAGGLLIGGDLDGNLYLFRPDR
jgi:hypothetical protein